jgi:preprotein translocase subunit YajC
MKKSPVKFGNFPLLLVLPARISVLFMGQGFWICEIRHPEKKRKKEKKKGAFLAPGQQV